MHKNILSQPTNKDNKIGNEGVRALSEALKSNTTLTALDVGCLQ